MVIKSIKEMRATVRIEIDLTRPDGNAFVLLGRAKDFAKQLNKNWKDIKKRMNESDYEHLIKVFEKEFGSFVTLYR